MPSPTNMELQQVDYIDCGLALCKGVRGFPNAQSPARLAGLRLGAWGGWG